MNAPRGYRRLKFGEKLRVTDLFCWGRHPGRRGSYVVTKRDPGELVSDGFYVRKVRKSK